MKPTIGRIVHYRMNQQDADATNKRRKDFAEAAAWRRNHGEAAKATGEQVHVGNIVTAGDIFPAMIVRTWGDTPESAVQLQVFLDGNDTYWATSKACGVDAGTWSWPMTHGEGATQRDKHAGDVDGSPTINTGASIKDAIAAHTEEPPC